MIDQQNYVGLKVSLNELDQFVQAGDLIDTIRDVEFTRSFSETVENFEEKPHYEADKKLFNQSRAVAFGNYAFMLYNKVSVSYLASIDEPILELLERHFYPDITLLEFFLDITSTERNFFHWENWIWNLEERLNGQVYTLPSREEILNFGLTIFFLRHPDAQQDVPKQILITPALEYIFTRSEESMKYLKQHSEQWLNILKVTNIEELENKTQKIISYYSSIKQQKDKIYYATLANALLAPNKIVAFADMIIKQWRETQNLTQVFEYFDAIGINPEQELQRIGMNINAKKAKTMFVDTDQYTHIYNIEWGKEINRRKEELLGQRLFEAKLDRQSESDFIKALDKAIDELKEGQYTPAFILTSAHSFFMQEQSLINSGHYVPAWQYKQERYPFKYLGVYKNTLPIIRFFSRILRDKVVIMSLSKSVRLYERENIDWYDKRLQVEVKLITKEKALQLYEKNKEEYSGLELIDALNNIMSGVIVDIDEICDFKILDRDGIKMIALK